MSEQSRKRRTPSVPFHEGDEVIVPLGVDRHRAVVLGTTRGRVRVHVYIGGRDDDAPLTSLYRVEDVVPA